MELEPEMLATETVVPVYFALEDDELLSIYSQTLTSSSSQGSLSAAEGRGSKRPNMYRPAPFPQVIKTVCSVVLLHTATANGFQMVTSGAQSKAVSDWVITSLEVRQNPAVYPETEPDSWNLQVKWNDVNSIFIISLLCFGYFSLSVR